MKKQLNSIYRYFALGVLLLSTIASTSAQLSSSQIQQAKSRLSTKQIEQLKSDPTARQQAVQQAKAAGATDEQIQQGLQQLDGKNNRQTTSKTGRQTKERIYTDEQLQGMEGLQDSLLLAPKKEEPVDLTKVVFGREIFSNKKLTFEPTLNIATPKGYRLAAGDNVVVNIWGASQSYETYVVTPEGAIIIEGLGPVYLAGMSVEEAQYQLRQELSRMYQDLLSDQPSTYMSLTVGEIRSVKVNIVGEVMTPGTYTLPSVATLFNALYLAGGVNDIGSLRAIKVYRNNRQVAALDVYDYLLNGKYEGNIRLEDNDMIVVEPYVKLVATSGKLKRVRLFELKQQETLADLLRYAGGFTGDAYRTDVQVKRKNGRMHSLFNVEQADFSDFVMQDGDAVQVDSLIDRYNNRVIITGAIYRPGEYAISSRVRTVKQLVQKAEGITPEAFKNRVQLTRLQEDDTEEMISIDLSKLLRGEIADVELQKEDILHIPSIFDIREAYNVLVQGAVNTPDTIPYRDNMTLEDVIIQAGGLQEAASLVNVEVSRRRKDPFSTAESSELTETFNLTIAEDLKIVGGDVFTLKPFDVVNVRFSPGYQVQKSVTIEGEVLFNGTYVMAKKNERLSDLIRKAGGLSPDAYVKGASLQRKMSEAEKERVQTLLKLTTQSMDKKDSVSVNTLNIDHYAVGINLEQALKNPGKEADIILNEGDRLYVPRYMSTVKVSGAVIYPNTVSYEKGESVKDYLGQAGGYTDLARKRPIVIYANGKVGVSKRVLFWRRYPKVEPGCEILVPMKSAKNGRMSIAEVLGLATSATSMAAMITTMMK